jgi:ferrochelatase
VIGVLLLNFGEPDTTDLVEVSAFLERIFSANSTLEPGESGERARRRSRELAMRRAPGLVEEYRAIGGSPLRAQAEAQARALARELNVRGHEAEVLVGMQFASPTIDDAVARAHNAGAYRLVGLPVYPLCGHSTTVAALANLEQALARADWDVSLTQISGWHPHPAYLEIRRDAILGCAAAAGVDLTDPKTRLVFSVHGTPIKYLEAGSRYDRYAEECCSWVAAAAGADGYLLGYQNHANRGIEWTQPGVDEVVRKAAAEGVRRVVVDPISFMHEQSETLAELDGELREIAEGAELEYHRVPIPYDDERFAGVLADLVEAALDYHRPGGLELRPCLCRPFGGVRCLNGDGAAAG